MFGRKPGAFGRAIVRLPQFVAAAWRCVRVCRRPAEVLHAYIVRRNPKSGRVDLRDGTVIHLTADNADIVTVFLVFCRLDYGVLPAGGRVVDVGANIGIFAVHAARCGAERVDAFEPAAESFACLTRNVEDNRLQNRVFAHRAAVTGLPTGPVWFPRRSSVMNAIHSGPLPPGARREDFDEVPTITMADILSDGGPVQLLKLDCEGGEYDIFEHTPSAAFVGVRAIKLEYHHGPHAALRETVDRLGYRRERDQPEGPGGGYLWLTR